ALIFCRLVGLSHRSVQYLCFERRKLASLAQPDDYREIWKTRHWLTLHSFSHMAPGLLDNSQRVRSSTRNSSFQQVRMAFCYTAVPLQADLHASSTRVSEVPIAAT